MPEAINSELKTKPEFEIPFQSPTKPETTICTWAECPNEHRWIPELAISNCPGCKSPVVAIRLINCPVCNEPPKTHGLRAEHIVSGAWIGKFCQGQKGLGETTLMVLENEVYNKYKPEPIAEVGVDSLEAVKGVGNGAN